MHRLRLAEYISPERYRVRDLHTHEISGSHAISRHVSKTENVLRRRVLTPVEVVGDEARYIDGQVHFEIFRRQQDLSVPHCGRTVIW
jgi:hypothetical protein